MKCSWCMDELFKRIKNEVGKDYSLIEARMLAELPNAPEAVTVLGNGWTRCLHHYIEGKKFW